MEVVGFILALGLCAFLAWLGFRIEPHFVSKDGERFLCVGQKMNMQGDHLGRWRETRVVVDRGGKLQIDQKRFMRRSTTFWTVEAQSPAAPKRKAVFLLKGHDDQGLPMLLALRMPAKSRAVSTLSSLIRGHRSTVPPTVPPNVPLAPAARPDPHHGVHPGPPQNAAQEPDPTT